MFCTQCGIQLGEPEPNFCASCGRETSTGGQQYATRGKARRLERPREGRQIAGVCAGLADYFGLDVTLIRLVAVIALIFGLGSPAIAYLIAMVVIPNESFVAAQPATMRF
jgi:phage shock protein PspC (stress-responsive transcriptional regulator)